MPEFVHEDVVHLPLLSRDGLVRVCRRVQVVYPPSPVAGVVHENADEIIRSGGRDVAQHPVLFREHVTRGAERVVLRPESVVLPNVPVRKVDAALLRHDVDPPDIEVVLPLTERVGPEHRIHETPDVLPELLHIGRSIPVPHHDDVHLDGRRAVVDNGGDRKARPRTFLHDLRGIGGIDPRGEHLMEFHFPVPSREGETDRTPGAGESHAL